MKLNTLCLFLGAVTVILLSLQMNREISVSWWLVFAPAMLLITLVVANAIITPEIYTEECINCDEEYDVDLMDADDEDNLYCPKCWLALAPVLQAEYDELQRNGELD